MWMSVAFKYTRNIEQKSLFRKDSPTKAEREKVYYYETMTNTGKIIFG